MATNPGVLATQAIVTAAAKLLAKVAMKNKDDPYLLELTGYIHLNPLRAEVVKDMRRLGRYPWTGHSAIMRRVKRAWQDTDTVLAHFGRKRKEAIQRHEEFVTDGIAQGRRTDLVGGGLVRSAGGWSQVLSLRRKGIRVASDERIPEISKKTGVPAKTLERWIRVLRELGKIEFRGSSKTGGYFEK